MKEHFCKIEPKDNVRSHHHEIYCYTSKMKNNNEVVQWMADFVRVLTGKKQNKTQ